MTEPGTEGEREGALRTNCKSRSSVESNITIDMLVLQLSTYKGGLDTQDDPECSPGDHLYFLFCA